MSHVAQNMIQFSQFLPEIQTCVSKFDENLHHFHQNLTLFGIKQVINHPKYHLGQIEAFSNKKEQEIE